MSLKPHLFDSHCHLDDGQFDLDRENLLASLPEQGLAYALTCGSDLASSRASIALAEKVPYLYAAAGIHPHEASKVNEDDLSALRLLLKHPRVKALGEIGLDFHYDFSPRSVQEVLLSQQLDLAYEMGMPVVLHVREAHGVMIDLLKGREGRLSGGVLHCFSGSAESAMVYESMGFHISFAGSLTFKNAQKLRLVAEAVRLDRVLIETDSPYLAPVPYRGKRNDPSKVAEVCKLLAEIKGLTYDDMARVTLENACRLFKIS